MIRAGILLGLGLLSAACSNAPPTYQLVQVNHDKVRIPLELVSDGEVHFFSFAGDGSRVNFLVRTDRRGVLHAHFDACHSCYRYRRGFVVEGADLVCVACRYRYAIADEEWDFIGACSPISIHCELDAQDLVLDAEVLGRGVKFF